MLSSGLDEHTNDIPKNLEISGITCPERVHGPHNAPVHAPADPVATFHHSSPFSLPRTPHFSSVKLNAD
jgi:hypothetical protein